MLPRGFRPLRDLLASTFLMLRYDRRNAIIMLPRGFRPLRDLLASTLLMLRYDRCYTLLRFYAPSVFARASSCSDMARGGKFFLAARFPLLSPAFPII